MYLWHDSSVGTATNDRIRIRISSLRSESLSRAAILRAFLGCSRYSLSSRVLFMTVCNCVVIRSGHGDRGCGISITAHRPVPPVTPRWPRETRRARQTSRLWVSTNAICYRTRNNLMLTFPTQHVHSHGRF